MIPVHQKVQRARHQRYYIYAEPPIPTDIAKDVGKMGGSLYSSSKYLAPHAILYIHKSKIRPKMEYSCHIWALQP